ncbi:MAG: dTMP kinase [Gammaproteobacteria bacterium]|nr:dTMP kinase [Gammaproteobacteria bacterium]
MTTKLFITIEGIEGVGKSTAMRHITDYLQQRGQTVVATREPGGTEIAEQIRHILLTPHQEPVAANSELLLMFAARAQHIAQVILPALNAGKIVVSDRFTDASFAYQGGGRGMAMADITMLQQLVQRDLEIDLTILLDAPAEIGLQRATANSQPDRIEAEQIAFFQRVRQTYLQRAAAEPQRFHVIDATQPLAAVKTAINPLLDTLLTSGESQ